MHKKVEQGQINIPTIVNSGSEFKPAKKNKIASVYRSAFPPTMVKMIKIIRGVTFILKYE